MSTTRAAWLRGTCAAVVATVLVAVPDWQSVWVRASAPVGSPVPEVPGRLLYVTYDTAGRSVFRTYVPATGAAADLVVLPQGAYAGEPAAAPEGREVVFSFFRVVSAGSTDPGGADLHIMRTDGANPRPLLVHEAPGVSLAQPAWAPDGRGLYFARVGGGKTRVERLLLAGSRRQVIVENADSPAASSRGRLAYLTTDPATYTQTLWIAQPDGRGATSLVGPPAFFALASPRFSPDGRHIAVAGARDSGQPPGPPPVRRPGARLPAVAVRAAYIALAHGLPMDIYVMNADGTGLRQLTKVGEDDPVPAWSPDGRWIAFTGVSGLYLMDVGRGEVRRVYGDIAGGGLTWMPR